MTIRTRLLAALSTTLLLAGLGPFVIESPAEATAPCGTQGTLTGPTECTYGLVFTEDTFAVPPGVTSVHVVAIGGKGGTGGLPGQPQSVSSGGFGARVEGTVGVTAGSTLYVEVGGNGGNYSCFFCTIGGGFNGGGSSVVSEANWGGGGGGASDVRTVSRTVAGTLESRLLVAGGGGGGGGSDNNFARGGAGGAASAAGSNGTYAGGGGAGTASAGGAGGAGGPGITFGCPGGDGVAGTGGNGGCTGGNGGGGGGGGGGWFGGGGGGGGGFNSGGFGTGGGAGGGSSYPSTAAITADATGTPRIVITWTTTQAQAITFDPIADHEILDSPYLLAASASSGLDVTFSSDTPSVCQTGGTNGASLQLLALGECSIDADQSGNQDYDPAPTVTRNFDVIKAGQTITFGALSDRTLVESPFDVGATASSGLTVTFTSTTTDVCTVDGVSVTLLTDDTCTVQADQAGDGTYQAALAVTRSFTVAKASQSIDFGTLSDRALAASPFSVSATASSGLPVSFTSTTPSCTSSGTNGSDITLLATGTCTVEAHQAGDGTYLAADVVARSFNVLGGSQSITFAPLADRTLLESPVTVSATASSGLTVTFSTTTPVVCTVDGTSVTLLVEGTCGVQADQAGDGSYDAAPPVTRTFTVSKAAQAITFDPLPNRTLAESPVAVAATASSGLAVAFSSTTPAVCSVTGTSVTLVIEGTCTIRADQLGNATYAAAPPVTRSFTVSKAAQTITFGPLADRTLAASPFSVTATSSSGLPVSFTAAPTTVCTSGGSRGSTITLVAPGTCTVTARQAGNAIYSPATPVNQAFTVTKTTQVISFGALADRPYGSAAFTVTATSSSGLTVTFAAGPATVCTASGKNNSKITVVGVGICTVTATQPGNATYEAAPPVPRPFEVTKASQTISFGSLANRRLGQSPITVSATATSGLPVTFTTTTPSVCTSSGQRGATITLVAVGTCSVVASQSGDTNFNPAPSVTRSFTVRP